MDPAAAHPRAESATVPGRVSAAGCSTWNPRQFGARPEGMWCESPAYTRPFLPGEFFVDPAAAHPVGRISVRPRRVRCRCSTWNLGQFGVDGGREVLRSHVTSWRGVRRGSVRGLTSGPNQRPGWSCDRCWWFHVEPGQFGGATDGRGVTDPAFSASLPAGGARRRSRRGLPTGPNQRPAWPCLRRACSTWNARARCGEDDMVLGPGVTRHNPTGDGAFP